MKTLYKLDNGIEFCQNEQGNYCLSDGWLTDYVTFRPDGSYVQESGTWANDEKAQWLLGLIAFTLSQINKQAA